MGRKPGPPQLWRPLRMYGIQDIEPGRQGREFLTGKGRDGSGTVAIQYIFIHHVEVRGVVAGAIRATFRSSAPGSAETEPELQCCPSYAASHMAIFAAR